MFGIIAIMMKKLKNQTKISMDFVVIKSRSLLKMMERCFLQSRIASCDLLSQTPQDDPTIRQNRQKMKLRPSAIPKQYFLLQLVRKKVSIPSLTVQISSSTRMQKDMRVSLGVKKLMRYLMARNSTRPAAVVCTLENQLAKGQSLTFQNCISTTQTSLYAFSFFFLVGMFSGLSSGGINRAAPLGKNIRLGSLLWRQCKPAKIDTSRTVSTIILQNQYQINHILPTFINHKERFTPPHLSSIHSIPQHIYTNDIPIPQFHDFIYIPIIILIIIKKGSMLIGHRDDQNEKEIKLKKHKIYKEMLDKQILYNLRYKRQADERSREEENQFVDSIDHDGSAMPIIEHKKNESVQLDQSYVHHGNKHPKVSNRNVYLPAIQDKNTYYKGHSTFIKAKQKEEEKVTAKKPTHIKTQAVVHSQSDDEYHSNCERIIRELQNITKDQPKSRTKYRRKPYQFSQLNHYRRNHQQERQALDSRPTNNANTSFDYKVPSMIQFDKKVNHPALKEYTSTDLREQKQKSYSLHTDHSKQRHHMKTQTSKPKSYSNNLQQLPQSQPSQHKQINQFSQQSNMTAVKYRLKPMQQPSSDKIDKHASNTGESQFNSSHSNKQVQKITKLEATKDFPNRRQYVKPQEFIDSSTLKEERKRQQVVKAEQKISKVVQKHLGQSQSKRNEQYAIELGRVQVQRRNVIQLLRKVKNRGESLFLKLSKYPAKGVEDVRGDG